MLFPNHIEQKIGFDKIREILNEQCISPMGQKFANSMKFQTDSSRLEKLLAQLREMTQLIEAGLPFPHQNYFDINNELVKANIIGNWLSEDELFKIKLSLGTINQILKFLHTLDPIHFSALLALSENIVSQQQLLKAIEAVIDDKGKVRSDASSDLKAIRYELNYESSSLRKLSETLLRKYKAAGYCEDDTSVTVRNGRLVMPIAAEYKRKIQGFVIDESASGQTSFIEPVELLETNNRIKELEYMERREIIKLLTNLTAQVCKVVPELQKGVHFLGLMDFIRAKALLSGLLQSTVLEISKNQIIKLRDARHPLLWYNNNKVGKKVEPLSIILHTKERILIISGPNAGGKSVCLKTVGLLQYMFQCGLAVTAKEGSEMSIFKDMFVDIGDEQSIENDLSTYSSHLTSMKTLVENCGGKSLVLIDEFGGGTEPQYGGAIAESILLEINKKNVFAVITTHYANLKKVAENTSGLINGAMRYDLDELRPLYQLDMGKPGSSFALEIANKIGLPTHILELAQQKVGLSQVNFDKLMAQAQNDQAKLDEALTKAKQQQKDLAQKIAHYESLQTFLEDNKKSVLNEAKQKAKQLIADTNQKIETTIREIKENKAEKEITKLIREDLKDFGTKLKPEIITNPIETKDEEEISLEKGPIVKGCWVRMKGTETIGEVLSMNGNNVEMSIGDLRTNVKLNKLERISKKEQNHQLKLFKNSNITSNITEKVMHFSGELDVRGMRTEEAIAELETFLDNALILNKHEIKIIHGNGDGILRKMLRERLKQIKQVSSINSEHADRGGEGCTIIGLK